MTDFGVTPEGFRLKALSDILAEIEAAERAAFGAGINVQGDSVLGQLNGLFASQVADAWKVLQAVYRSFYPDSASGEALDNVLALTGAERLSARKSTVTLFLFTTGGGDTVPAGSIVSVGANGARFVTLGDTGGEAFDSIQDTEAEAEATGPVEAPAGAIDTIQTPVSGWSSKAAVISTNVEPFALENGQTLTLVVDGGEEQTVTFATADFVDITAATAQEVVDSINDQTIGLTAAVPGYFTDDGIRIASDTSGTGSSIQVTGGDSNPELGFSREEHVGFNWDRVPRLTGGNDPYTLADGMVLGISVDGGTEQQVIFSASDFVDITNATAIEVARVITAALTGAYSFRAGNGAINALAIESETAGIAGSLEVTGGTAVTPLGLTLLQSEVGIDGAAELGADLETDAAARARREQAVHVPTAGPLEALRAKLLTVDGVREVQILENPTHDVDANGLPPNSFECIVLGGDQVEIAQAIFDGKPLGIETYRDPGTLGVTETITDSQSETHEINFTRPDVLEMYVEITVTKGETFGGGDDDTGKDAVKDAIKALGDSLVEGDDVVATQIIAAVIGVAGVVDVTSLKFEDSDPPTNTANFPVTARAIARFSLDRISVTVE